MGDGCYRIIARHSGKSLEVLGAPEHDGVQLTWNTCDGSAAQAARLWKQSSQLEVRAASVLIGPAPPRFVA